MNTTPGSRSGWRTSTTGFWLFLLLAAVYLLSYSGGFHAIDEVSVAAMTESLVKHGRVTTDQIWWSQGWTPSQGRTGPDGHLYSKKGVGSALLGAPFYWLSVSMPRPVSDSGFEIGSVSALMLANTLVTALTAWLIYACVHRLGYQRAVAVATALGYGLGTMAWPYAKYFFSEPMTALGLMMGLWGLLAFRQSGRVRFVVLAGTGLGVALLAKVANAVTWPLFAGYAAWAAIGQGEGALNGVPQAPSARVKRLAGLSAALLLPMLAACLALAIYNLARTGSLLDLGYAADETFSTPLFWGLAGLLGSPGKGLFLYSPILLASLLGIPGLVRRDPATAFLSLGMAALFPLLYAGWYMWWGGWSWGPRFLVPALPFLSLFLAPVVEWVLQPSRRWARALLVALALASLWVQIMGVAVDFNQYLLLLYQRGLDSGEINFRVALSPLLGHWTLFRAGNWDLAWKRGLDGGVDWPRLFWPLALFAGVFASWLTVRRIGRVGRWLMVAGALGLAIICMAIAARLLAPGDDWQLGTQLLSTALQEEARPGDVLIVDLLPYADHLGRAVSLLDRYKADPPYWGWARQEPVSAERQAQLARLGQLYKRLWLVLDTTPDADPASTTERWLDEHAFRVANRWISPAMRLVRYELSPLSLSEDPRSRLDLRLGERLWLRGMSPPGMLEGAAGDVLTFSLFWQAAQPVEEDLSVFVQLLDQQGRLLAQLDRPPVAGFRPTSGWKPGELIRDNYGLELPSDLPPGQYQLIAGLYLPATMERLSVSTAEGLLLGDYAPLTTVLVSEGEGQ